MATNWTIGKKLYAIVGALALLLAVASGYALWTGSTLNDGIDTALTKTAKAVDLAQRIDQNAVIVRSEERHSLLAGFGKEPGVVDQAAKTIDDTIKLNNEQLQQIEPLIVSAEGKKLVGDIRTAMDAWDTADNEVARLAKAGKETEALTEASEKCDPIIVKIGEMTDKLLEEQARLVKAAQTDSAATYSGIRYTMFGITFISLMIVIGAVITVRGTNRSLRQIAAELKDGAQQIESAAGQVSTSAQSLSEGATEQASSLEETSASMEEMASMTRRNSENAVQAARLVTDVANQVTASNTALGEMVGSMAEIRESSNKVAKIIKTIDEIAFQTNILALNAAVEAARAGEAGMGFAVVADEVRNLAQRSAQAAKDTAGLIEESIVRSQEGSAKVEQVAATIGTITESVNKVKGIVDEVREASQQQTQGIDQVTEAVMQMEKVTQTTAATAEESAAASEELNAQAETSMTTVRELEAMVGQSGTQEVTRRSTPAQPKARPAARVLAIARKPATARKQTAEEAIPLEDTGTFGKF